MNENSEPGWNSSTMCLRVLHRNMSDQGWAAWQPATPVSDYEFQRYDYELPRRPLDLGVGLWR